MQDGTYCFNELNNQVYVRRQKINYFVTNFTLFFKNSVEVNENISVSKLRALYHACHSMKPCRLTQSN